MSLSTDELARARAIVTAILDEIQLDVYLFGVELRGDDFELRVECAVEEGWETIALTESKERLLASVNDPETQRQLLDKWRKVLSACRHKSRQ